METVDKGIDAVVASRSAITDTTQNCAVLPKVRGRDTDCEPRSPSCPKASLYSNIDIFHKLDKRVIELAQEDQTAFTDLVRELTRDCTSELEKVRAIFRWITVKDLSEMILEECADSPDTPLGILRGIKLGTETYHLLFMRLCSYAGIRCEEIKGEITFFMSFLYFVRFVR